MSVYAKERADRLEASLQSVFEQTLCANEVLLLEDGLLTEELYEVVSKFKYSYPEFRVVNYAENRGVGQTLNEGLLLCSNAIVARMDSDDICRPERFEVQYNWLLAHDDYSLVGSWIDEFVDSPENVVSQRRVPEKYEEILAYAKRRCPVNHPTVMFRKEDVLRMGGYMTELFPEDYYLWIEMLRHGMKFYNIQSSLLFFRLSPDVVYRRGGWKYAKDEAIVQYRLYKKGFISLRIFIENVFLRFITRVAPPNLRSFIYKIIRKVDF